MKIKCQDCDTIIDIDESDYSAEGEYKIECPLCGNEISFNLSKKENKENENDLLLHKQNEVEKKEKHTSDKRSVPNFSYKDVEVNADLETVSEQLNEQDSPIFDNSSFLYKFSYYLGYYSQYIKKSLIALGFIVVIFFIAKYVNNNHSGTQMVDTGSIVAASDSIVGKKVINESDSIISFLTMMYSSSFYNDYRFLQEHCTQHLLALLSEAYDYDCHETPCYATWLFRSSAQEEKSSTENESRVLFIKDLGENWFEIELYDMGWKCVKRIKVYFNSQGIIMDNVETVFDEVEENMKNMQEHQDSLNATSGLSGYVSSLSDRKLNVGDIADLSKDKIELLRNMIFARYGYRFNRDDLNRYFSQFIWYHPQYDDAGNIYENLSEIEKYNVDFLKAHE